MGTARFQGGFFASHATNKGSRTTLKPNKHCYRAKRNQLQISKLQSNMGDDDNTSVVEAHCASFEILMDTKIKPSTVSDHTSYENLSGLLENILLDFLESNNDSYLTNIDPDMGHTARYWVDCHPKTGTVFAKLNLIFTYNASDPKPELSKPKLKSALMLFATTSFPSMTVVKKCL
jgi:hypothetical protein